MNTPTRRWASPWQLKHLQIQLSGFLMEGEDAATLLDALHDTLEQSSYKRIGSSSLSEMADTIRSECALFAEVETEIHEAEMQGETA